MKPYIKYLFITVLAAGCFYLDQQDYQASDQAPAADQTHQTPADSKTGDSDAAAPQAAAPSLDSRSIPADNSGAVSGTDCITYAPGFTYEPIPQSVIRRITGCSYPEDCPLPYSELRYLNLMYVDYSGETQQGELICNKAIAQDLIEIFYELYQAGYPLATVSLIDDYGANDEASMQANNTSCFNYRKIAGSGMLSNHSYGLAVDINPLYNPYVTATAVSPSGSGPYADRSSEFISKIDHEDLAYRLFTEHGFTWGGDWVSRKDYQHFEKSDD